MKQTAIALLLFLFVAHAYADDESSWRVGGSLSYSDYNEDDGVVNDGAVGFKLHAQYRLNSWAAAEGALYVGPEFKGDLTPDTAGGETETSYQGVTLHGVAYLPSPNERLDFFVKGGYFDFYDANVKIIGGPSNSFSDDGLALGFGTAIEAGDDLGIRVEVDWYDVSGADLWTVGIGVEYRF